MIVWPCRALRVPSLEARAAGQRSLSRSRFGMPLSLILALALIWVPGFAQEADEATRGQATGETKSADQTSDDDSFLFGDDEAESEDDEAAEEIADDATLGLPKEPEKRQRRRQTIEELKVTGRKREELLQEVPVSIRAFGAGEIEERNMQRLSDIGFATANLQFTGANGSNRDSRIYIRGIGQADPRSILDPGVGLYIDNVYIPRATNALIDLVDLERIDILRGPQGTLFGKNTVGGLVNVIATKPQQELGGNLRLNVGSFDTLETRLSVDVPIKLGWFDEKLFTRWTIATATDDGYLTNVYDNSESGDNKLLAGRFAATLLASDRVTMNTTFDWMRSNENAMVGRCKISGQESATLSADGTRMSYGPYVIARYIADNFGTRDDFATPPGLVEGQDYRFPEACAGVDSLDRFEGYANPLARLRETSYGTSLDLDWDLPETWGPKWMTTDIRNVFGFRLRDVDNDPADFDGTPIEYVTLGSVESQHYAISDDITATMDFETWTPDIGVRLIAGVFGFYEREDTGGFGDINRDTALGNNTDFNNETFDTALLANVVDSLGTSGKTGDEWLLDSIRYGSSLLNTQTYQNWHNTSVAGYAHVEFDLYEDWSVTGGIRYSWEKKERSGERYGLLCGELLGDTSIPSQIEVNAVPAFGIPDIPIVEGPDRFCGAGDTPAITVVRDQKASWQRATPEAGVKYQMTEEQMTYFRYAQGWKSGGFNREVLTERRDTFTDENGLSDQFEPEVVNAYEIGFKSSWLDNQVFFNVALFWNDYSNLQITALEPDENGLVSANITNAADAVTRGFEIETTLAPDWEWLPGPDAQFILSGGLGYTDAYYKEYTASVADSPYPVKVECQSLKRVTGADPNGCNSEIDNFVNAVIVQSVLLEPTSSTPDDRSGNQFPNVPKLNFNILGMYNFTILNEATISTSLRYYYQTQIFFNVENSPNLYQPGYGLLDGSIALIIEPTNTRIELWAKNLTDQEYLQGGFSFGPAFGADGVYVGRPRSFGMTLTQTF